jgi:uncharacterized protein (DUF488 family)
MKQATIVWTVGHSNRLLEELLRSLEAFGIEVVVDVRRFPGSKRHPQFGAEALSSALGARSIDYAWLPALGGRRRVPPGAQHLGWRNASFRSYAAYMWTEEFAEGLGELLHIASARRTTMMCSEALWWRCHRALISDALLFLGYEVVHIFGPGSSTVHAYTSPAHVASGMLSYASRES